MQELCTFLSSERQQLGVPRVSPNHAIWIVAVVIAKTLNDMHTIDTNSHTGAILKAHSSHLRTDVYWWDCGLNRGYLRQLYALSIIVTQ
jgi:hypothetical protein